MRRFYSPRGWRAKTAADLDDFRGVPRSLGRSPSDPFDCLFAHAGNTRRVHVVFPDPATSNPPIDAQVDAGEPTIDAAAPDAPTVDATRPCDRSESSLAAKPLVTAAKRRVAPGRFRPEAPTDPDVR
jgi:hypothetical protein